MPWEAVETGADWNRRPLLGGARDFIDYEVGVPCPSAILTGGAFDVLFVD